MYEANEGTKERRKEGVGVACEVWPGRGGAGELRPPPLFLPLSRSLGCFPCLHSIRRLAKKFCTRHAAGGAFRAGPSLLAHSQARKEGAPCCDRRADLFCKSSFAMQAWKAAERANGRARERGERPLPNSLPFPSPPGASCSPSFLPSSRQASAPREGFSSYYAKKEEYNITGPAQPCRAAQSSRHPWEAQMIKL